MNISNNQHKSDGGVNHQKDSMREGEQQQQLPQIPQFSSSGRGNITCQALTIVLEHWLIPTDLDDYSSLIGDKRKDDDDDELRNNIADYCYPTVTPKKRQQIAKNLKTRWGDAFNQSMITTMSQQFQTGLESRLDESGFYIPMDAVFNENMQLHQFSYVDAFRTIQYYHRSLWLPFSYRLQYYTLHCIHDLLKAYYNLQQAVASFFKKQQTQHCSPSQSSSSSGSLIVYQLVLYQRWKCEKQSVIEMALLWLMVLARSLDDNRHDAIADRYYPETIHSDNDQDAHENLEHYSNGIQRMAEDFGSKFNAVEQMKIPELLDTLQCMTTQIQSIPFHGANSSYLFDRKYDISNEESLKRQWYSIEMNMQRLWSRKCFERCFQHCMILANLERGTREIPPCKIEAFSIPSVYVNRLFQSTQKQIKEARFMYEWMQCMSEFTSKDKYLLSDKKKKEEEEEQESDKDADGVLYEKPQHIFINKYDPYQLLSSFYYAQYTGLQVVYRRLPSQNPRQQTARSMPADEQEAIERWKVVSDKTMVYCYEALILANQLIANPKDDDDNDNELKKNDHWYTNDKAYQELICEKIHLIEGLVSFFSSFTHHCWDNRSKFKSMDNYSDPMKDGNNEQLYYYEFYLQMFFDAIQRVETLIFLYVSVLKGEEENSSTSSVIDYKSIVTNHDIDPPMIQFYSDNNHQLVSSYLALQLYYQRLLLNVYQTLLPLGEDRNAIFTMKNESTSRYLPIHYELSVQVIELVKEVSMLKANKLIRQLHQEEEEAHQVSSQVKDECILYKEQTIQSYLSLAKYIQQGSHIKDRSWDRQWDTAGSSLCEEIDHEVLGDSIKDAPRTLDANLQHVLNYYCHQETRSNHNDSNNAVVVESIELFIQRVTKKQFVQDIQRIQLLDLQHIITLLQDKDNEIKQQWSMTSKKTSKKEIEQCIKIEHPLRLYYCCSIMMKCSNDVHWASALLCGSESAMRRWEYYSEFLYWHDKALNVSMLMMEIRNILKRKYGLVDTKLQDDDDSESESDIEVEEKEEQEQEQEQEQGRAVDDRHRDNREQYFDPFGINQDAKRSTNYPMFVKEYQRCLSSFQFILDNYSRFCEYDKKHSDLPSRRGSLVNDAERIVTFLNESIVNPESVEFCKSVSMEHVHLSVDEAFRRVSTEIYNRNCVHRGGI